MVKVRVSAKLRARVRVSRVRVCGRARLRVTPEAVQIQTHALDNARVGRVGRVRCRVTVKVRAGLRDTLRVGVRVRVRARASIK